MFCNLKARLWAGAVLCLISAMTWAAVGRIEGVADVTSTGAASYEIPLSLPPGTAGIQPEFSLSYNSQRGNGILGPGWALSGIPSITRCNRTVAQDGAPAAITLTNADAFCLDGKRLRITSGVNGQSGTTYDTEIAEFSRITALGTAGNGPASFELRAKNGLIYEFGMTADSRITPSPSVSTANVWLLNKVRNRSDTSYSITYGTGAAGSVGIGVPLSISYAPVSAGAGSYNNTISFVYGAKASQMPGTTDPAVVGYVAGLQVANTNLLIGINASVNGTLTHKYTLGYEAGPTSTRARLATITQCGGSSGTDCLAPTTIRYQNGATGVSTSAITAVTANLIYLGSPDVNGDGRNDIVYADVGERTAYAALANGTGVSAPIAIGSYGFVTYNLIAFGDVTGSGKADVLIPQAGAFTRFSWNGTSFSSSATGTTLPPRASTPVRAALTDMDADGRADLIIITQDFFPAITRYTNTIVSYRNTSTGGGASFAAANLAYSANLECGGPGVCQTAIFAGSESRSSVQDLDFNGDGRKDLAMVSIVPSANGAGYQVSYLISNGTTFTLQLASADAIGFAGFALWNDDACTDTVVRNNVFLAKCNAQPPAALPLAVSPLSTIDWNGDGYTDVLVQNGTTIGVIQSSGTGTTPLIPTSIPVTGQPGPFPGSPVSSGVFVFDYDGDGQHDLGMWNRSSIVFYPHNSPGAPPDLATSITDGYGNYANFRYQSLTSSGACYSRTSGDPPFPERAFMAPLQLVCSSTASDGRGGSYTVDHNYFNANLNVQGRGFEGVGTKRTRDSRNGLYRFDTFNLPFPYTGTLAATETYQPDGSTLILRAANTWVTYTYGSAPETRSLSYVSTASNQQYEIGGTLNGLLVRSTATTSSVDSSSGTLVDSTTTVTEGINANGLSPGQSFSFRTYTPTLFNDFANWCIGRPQSTQQINSHTAVGGTQLTRTSGITWDGFNCRPSQQAIEPGNAQYQVTTDIVYDSFGNPSQVTVTPATGQGQSARVTMINWGSNGQFPLIVTNPKSQVTQFDWNAAFGLRASVTDPNSLTTTWQYDNFGRMKRQQLADGTATEVVRGGCTQGGFTELDCGMQDLRFYIQLQARDATNAMISAQLQVFDGFERTRYSYQELLNGLNTSQVTTYDPFGRVVSQTTPHIENVEPVRYTTFTYDLPGRVKQVERPVSESDSSTHLTQFSYLGLTTTTTDALNRTTSRKFNAVGQVLQSIDAVGNDTDYEYDAFGQLLKTRDIAGNEITLGYNVRGFKMMSNDPDLGAWSYTYYPLGELKTQTTAKGQTATFNYDALSRVVTRVEPEGTTTFTYDTATKGIGQLAMVSSPGGYSETYLYDTLGRPAQQSIVADAMTYTVDQTYNTLGLLDTLTYPTSTSGVRFKVKYGYNYGYLQNVRDYTGNVLGTTFWQGNAVDSSGQLIDETLGNGVRTFSAYDRITGLLNTRTAGVGGGTALQNLAYSWDKLGNLMQRQDLRQASLTEAFFYDPLYRLDYSTLNGTINLDLAYDSIGNITSKSGVGSYTYDTTKKHAVRTAGSNTYTYDANGNAITRNGSTITWTSYNLPSLINGTGGSSSAFSYGPDRQRWKQTASYSGTTETTLYIGGILEKVVLGGVASWRHHVFGGDGEVAVYTRKSSGTNETHYLSKDHLGSTDVITNAAGAVEVRESFSAFGQRRNAAGWSGNPTMADWTAVTNSTRHGYTGHEMLDNLNLTHMNGRVYDQITGRFLSPDPFVQAPFNGQSLNRYSYVFNNPLSFTDPSGFVARCSSSGGDPFTTTFTPLNNGIMSSPSDFGRGSNPALCPGFDGADVDPESTPRGPRLPRPRQPASPPATNPTTTGPAPPIDQVTVTVPAGIIGGSAVGGAAAASIAVGGSAFEGAAARALLRDPRVAAALGVGLAVTVGVITNLPSNRYFAKSEESRPVPVFSVRNAVTTKVEEAARRGDGFITSFKAPTLLQVPVIQGSGFSPADFPGEGPFFSFNPAAVFPYAQNRGAGVFVVNTRLSVFTNLIFTGRIVVDPLVSQSFSVLPSGLAEFTRASTIVYLPPTSNEFYELFLK